MKKNYCELISGVCKIWKSKFFKKMWIVALLLLISITQTFALDAYAQNKRLSINVENETIVSILEEIESQSEFYFMFDASRINVNQRKSVDCKNQTIKNILDQLFEKTGIKYSINDLQVLLITDKSDSEQQKPITGKVTEENGNPLPGVTVVVKGTTSGTITDANGNFSLANVPADATLAFSFVGMKPQEVKVAGKSVINATMVEDAIGIDEVVAIGYGIQKRANVTGAVSTVSSKELVRAPVANATQSLAGRMPGLITRQASGEPGNDNVSVSIRGFGDALIIVDGVECSMTNLDPNEIETVSILKDASAAIYGARAGNGVILITTKRGKTNKPTITINSTYSLQSPTKYPDLMSSAQYAELVREAQENVGTPESSMKFTKEDVIKFQQGKEEGYLSYDWLDRIMKRYSQLQQHNLSSSGGNDAISYYTFLGYTDQGGIWKSGDNKLQRYNIRANIDAKINDNLKASFDLSTIIEDISSPIRDVSQVFDELRRSIPTYPTSYPDPTKLPYAGNSVSSIASTSKEFGGYYDQLNTQIFSTFKLEYKIPGVNGLSLKAFVNYTQNNNEAKRFQKKYNQYIYDYNSQVYYNQGSGEQFTWLAEDYVRSMLITGQFSANYEKTFAKKHKVAALVLAECMDSYSKNLSASRFGFVSDKIDYLFAGDLGNQGTGGGAFETGRISYVGRFNYNYDEKYLIEATTRYDGSPKFAEDKRWGFFPSVSVGWRMSEEAFIDDKLDWIDNLKIRASYSNTGYDGIGAFQYMTGYQYSGTHPFIVDGTARVSLVSTGLANPFITWEEMTTYNFGVDYSILNSLLYGEVDLFYRYRDEILANRQESLPNTFGATLPQENINSMSNRGFEFVLGHRGKIGDITYDVSGNVSLSRAKWDHYEEPSYDTPEEIRRYKQSGNWVNRTFGYEADGLFASQEEIDNYLLDQDNQGNATLLPGDIKYIDQNGDHVLNWKDEVQIGYGEVPEMMFGMNINMQYKGFDLSALLQGAARRNLNTHIAMSSLEGNFETLYEKRWTEAKNDENAEIPRQYLGDKVNNSHNSSYWLKDASYLRLKSLNLGYNIPQSWLSKMKISGARIYVAGTNLFTISELNKWDIDPEVPTAVRSYPLQKTYSIGLNIKL